MDSLDTVELLLQIEEEYNVRLDAKEFKDFKTLRDSIKYFVKISGPEAFDKKSKE